MVVTEATESISCTEMGVREIAELLENDGMSIMNYQFTINNESWLWDEQGLRCKV